MRNIRIDLVMMKGRNRTYKGLTVRRFNFDNFMRLYTRLRSEHPA